MDYPQDKAKTVDDHYKRLGDALFKARASKEVVKREPRVFPARGLRRDWVPAALYFETPITFS